jgi:hypothetical protein
MIDWSKVEITDEAALQKEATPYLQGQAQQQADAANQAEADKSVLSPTYRPRSPLGGQEIGGFVGSVGGGLLGAYGGPLGAVGGSVFGAGVGGAAGEAIEQYVRGEPSSPSRTGSAGLEEAAWDAGGNLVFKTLGKTFRVGADMLGFTSKDAPDAVKAADAFLRKEGSSLPAATASGSPFLETMTGLMRTPVTENMYKSKEKEIETALETGATNILKEFTTSPAFAQALSQGTSAQRASGQVLQSFIKDGETALGNAVKPLYEKIWGDKASSVSLFDVSSFAKRELNSPSSLTDNQKSILKEIGRLPPSVDVKTLHDIRSRWLAENRDKYSEFGSAKDGRAVKTISTVIDKLDEAADFAAARTLDPATLNRYKSVTKRYREGVQGLNTEAVQEAMKLDPEQVGSYLFAAGKETPVNQLYKSIAMAGKLSGKSSKEVMDSLRYGYVQAMTNTPDNIISFARNLEQNQSTKNTFNIMFDTDQKKTIQTLADAAKLGNSQFKTFAGSNAATTSALYGGSLATAAGAYAFLMSPEQQQRINDNLGSTAVIGGALLLNQRTVAKMLLDPQGRKTLGYLAKAKDKLTTPSAFTKLVVEPIMNFYSPPGDDSELFDQRRASPSGMIDWSKVQVGE